MFCDRFGQAYTIEYIKKIAGKGKLFTSEELEFIKNHCYEYYKDVAEALNRNPETVRKYMGKYRREFNND